MGLPQPTPKLTIPEYFDFELASPEKHEFIRGDIFTMQGDSRMHSKIKVNLIAELRNRLRGKPCQPYDSDFRVAVRPAWSYFYPDASIFCGPIESDEFNKDTGTNPSAVFEVVSLSSERYDRGKKFTLFRTSESLQHYVLISQEYPIVEVYRRNADPDRSWQLIAYTGMSAIAHLPTLDLELPLADLYEGVEFPPEKDLDHPFRIREPLVEYGYKSANAELLSSHA